MAEPAVKRSDNSLFLKAAKNKDNAKVALICLF